MKYIIDLIENVREQIGNNEAYAVIAGLLKADEHDSSKLIYAGEAAINKFSINDTNKELLFNVEMNASSVSIGALMPPLLILGMDSMMYGVKMDINTQYHDMDVVGFGKNDEEKKYILFIKI
jgi:hypothetical protein